MASFESRDEEPDERLRPMRVAVRREDVYAEAKDMVADLGWKLVRADDAALELVCERAGGFLRAEARITVKVDGPEGIPSATVTVRSESASAFARDKENVRAFLEPFRRRVG
jgi:hypothetical protein